MTTCTERKQNILRELNNSKIEKLKLKAKRNVFVRHKCYENLN